MLHSAHSFCFCVLNFILLYVIFFGVFLAHGTGSCQDVFMELHNMVGAFLPSSRHLLFSIPLSPLDNIHICNHVLYIYIKSRSHKREETRYLSFWDGYLMQHDTFHLHPFSCNWQNIILSKVIKKSIVHTYTTSSLFIPLLVGMI